MFLITRLADLFASDHINTVIRVSYKLSPLFFHFLIKFIQHDVASNGEAISSLWCSR